MGVRKNNLVNRSNSFLMLPLYLKYGLAYIARSCILLLCTKNLVSYASPQKIKVHYFL